MKFPPSYKNWLSIIGSIVAIINFILIILLFIISTLLKKDGTNLGLFIYIILPGFLILGLILIPVGMYFRRLGIRRRLKGEPVPLPRIDLNDPRQKRTFIIFSAAIIVFLFLSTFGSFEAYHLTESVEFCGTLCHNVMEPEYTAYRSSPHANVTCVDCHVGSGASWYVRSKLSGLYQVYAVLADVYPSPIPTPLHDLRPARETCERCHWPEKFYPRSLHTNKYFMTDSLNSEWDIMLQMKTGPEYSDLGFREGIHWHINPSIIIEYLSDNDRRENITYVKYTDRISGAAYVYRNPDNPVSDSLISAGTLRTMDCIDCHNRPTHNFNSPPFYIDKAMLTGAVSKEIPFIKKTAMTILRETFSNKDSALLVIRDSITNFYRSNYSEMFRNQESLFNNTITSIQNEYALNTFPSMKVTYDVYPDHIGHMETEGCFRCHNDAFSTEDGRKISRDCNLCHTIVGQGVPKAIQLTNVRDTLQFIHPIDIGTVWKEANCSECHRYLY